MNKELEILIENQTKINIKLAQEIDEINKRIERLYNLGRLNNMPIATYKYSGDSGLSSWMLTYGVLF